MPSACMGRAAPASPSATASPAAWTLSRARWQKASAATAATSSAISEVVDFIRSTASGFIFTTSLPPTTVAAALASVWHVRRDAARRAALFANAAKLKGKLSRAGLPILHTPSHIVPVHVGDADQCREVSRRLLQDFSIYATPINYPTVPKGTERLRLTPTPLHTEAMMDALTDALLAVIPQARSLAA